MAKSKRAPSHKYVVWIPIALWTRLVQTAKKENRSVCQQIVHELLTGGTK